MEIQCERTMAAARAPHPASHDAADGWAGPGVARTGTALAERDLPSPGLSPREIDVLNGLAAGLSEREIALRLMVFEPAVRAALRSIFRKLRVRSRAEAVANAAPPEGDV